MAEKARQVLLAEKWNSSQDPTGWWVSEKLDGVRAFWTGSNFYSRLGNQFPAPEWFKKGLPSTPLDGELWCGRRMFQKCVSIVKNTHKGDEWKYVTYLVFDAPNHGGKFEERLDYLKRTVTPEKTPYARAVGMIKCEGRDHLMKQLREVEKVGGEGLMLRKPRSDYEWRRSTVLLKVKTFHEEEAIVVAHERGEGRNAHRMGHLVCKTPDGREFSVGTGFTDAQRDKPPPIGTMITYRYQELSDPPSLKPRFPAFVGVRIDLNWREYCASYVPPTKADPGALRKSHTILFSAHHDARHDDDDDDDAAPANRDDHRDRERERGREREADRGRDRDRDEPKPRGGHDDRGKDRDRDTKPPCRYGAACYRKSKEHLSAYSHPDRKPAAAAPRRGVESDSDDDNAVICPHCKGRLKPARGEKSETTIRRHLNDCAIAKKAKKRELDPMEDERITNKRDREPADREPERWREREPERGREREPERHRQRERDEESEERPAKRPRLASPPPARRPYLDLPDSDADEPAVRPAVVPSGAKLTAFEKPDISLPLGSTLVGRGLFHFDDPRMSRRHVEFDVAPGPIIKLRHLGVNPVLLRRRETTQWIATEHDKVYILEHMDRVRMVETDDFAYTIIAKR
eukprot:TRINITY_DN4954_c0_g1_i1.p1 TRINITY_DN4954_c0_g1~~TRINITY_DN4954_c0_g1_i1.p1  ORF type:complete len:631 (+),score=94.26 TRINITY_DN4954_c0_g1_i1:1-1893(+)